MKHLIINTTLILVLSIFFLTSCGCGHPTPKLVKQYDKLSFKYTEAAHKDWTRHFISEDYSYDEGFYINDKKDHYFNIYKNDELVYKFEHDDPIFVNSVTLKNNKIYFLLTIFNGNDILYKIGFVDEEYNYNLLYENNSERIDYVNFENYISFLKASKDENKIITIDYNGELVDCFNLDHKLGLCVNLLLTKDNQLVLKLIDDLQYYYLFSISGTCLKLLNTLSKDIHVINMSYNNDLYLFGYKDSIEHSNLKNIKIYEYKNDTLMKLFDIDLPDDYSYSISLIEQYKNNIYIGFTVNVKNVSKSLYSRQIILKCDKINNKINTIYKNLNVSHNCFYNNGNIYVGSYANSKIVDNQASGDFYEIDLNQFN